MLVQVAPALLPIQLPANMLSGKQQTRVENVGTLLALAWASFGCCGKLESEPVGGRSLSAALSNKKKET